MPVARASCGRKTSPPEASCDRKTSPPEKLSPTVCVDRVDPVKDGEEQNLSLLYQRRLHPQLHVDLPSRHGLQVVLLPARRVVHDRLGVTQRP